MDEAIITSYAWKCGSVVCTTDVTAARPRPPGLEGESS